MQTADILKLASDRGARKFNAGAQIVKAGTKPSQGLCMVLAGSAGIMHHKGESNVKLASIPPGHFFGEYSLILGRPLDIDAFAECDETVVLFMDFAKFLSFARSTPSMLKTLLTVSLDRISKVMQTGLELGVPVALHPDPAMVRVMQENRANNLKILAMVNNTRSAFVPHERCVFEQDDPNNGQIYLVTEGRISAIFAGKNETATVMAFFPGDIFGFSRPDTLPLRPFTTRADMGNARVMGFTEDMLVKVLSLDLDCFFSVFRTVATQIVLLDQALHQAQKAP